MRGADRRLRIPSARRDEADRKRIAGEEHRALIGQGVAAVGDPKEPQRVEALLLVALRGVGHRVRRRDDGWAAAILSGARYAQIHLPTACQHCENPRCMLDCPPDAIARYHELIAAGFPSVKIFTTDIRPPEGRQTSLTPIAKIDTGRLEDLMRQIARHGGVLAVHGEDDGEQRVQAAAIRPASRYYKSQDNFTACLSFDDGSVDTVLCQMALMFFPDRVEVLREMARVAGSGGQRRRPKDVAADREQPLSRTRRQFGSGLCDQPVVLVRAAGVATISHSSATVPRTRSASPITRRTKMGSRCTAAPGR